MKHLLFSCMLLLSITVLAQKKPLDHSVYDQWQSIKDVSLSNDGLWMTYTISPQEGDGVLVVQHLKTNQKFTIERATQAQFTDNNSFFLAKIKPTFNETRQAKISKKKTEEMPKDSLLIIDLQSNELKKIASVKSFQLPTKNSSVLVYLKDKKADIAKEGSDLVIYQLQTKKERVISNIAQYQVNPLGQSVALLQVKTKTSPASVLLASTNDTVHKIISSTIFSATNLTWDEQGKQLAYLVEKDSTNKALQKEYNLAYYIDQ